MRHSGTLSPSKLPRIGTTIFTEMSALAQAHGALNMSQGFPDFDPPQALRTAVTDAMNDGQNQYAPMAGNIALREWIAKDVMTRTGCAYDAQNEITVGAGASSLLFATFQAFVNPGDEVIVLAPAYDLYQPAVELAGGTIRVVPLDPLSYRMDISAISDALRPETRMLVVNVPNNPTGSVWSMADLEALHQLLKDTDILIVSDEVYGPLQHDGRQAISLSHHLGLASRGLIAASFGKVLHATGWKIGYLLGPGTMMKEVRKVHQYDVFSTGAPFQAGIAAYLQRPPGRDHMATLAEFYQAKRDRLLKGLEGSQWSWQPAEAGYFQVLDYSAFDQRDDRTVTRTWCELGVDHGIALIPLSPFYPTGLPAGHSSQRVRVCFAKNDATLDEGIQRLLRISETILT